MIKAGTASVDITPPLGTKMAGFPNREPIVKAREAEGVRDPLLARSIALRDGGEPVVICSADVIFFQSPDVEEIRRDFAQRSGCPGENLILCGTHTHHGPEVSYLFGGRRDDPAAAMVREKVAACAAESLENLSPAKLSVGSEDTELNYNRLKIQADGTAKWMARNPDRERIGPVDPCVTSLQIASDANRPIASIVHFAAHPVILSTPNRLFTAGFPGATLQFMKEQAGIETAFFLQGAAGDLHPYQALTESWDGVDEMGRQLGTAALSARDSAVPVSDPEVRRVRHLLEVPHRYRERLQSILEITVIKLGSDLALVFWPGEPFIELALSLQWHSPFSRTIVVGYSGGWAGYIPHRKAYHHGGYGVDLHEEEPAQYGRTQVTAGTGEQLVEETARMLDLLSE